MSDPIEEALTRLRASALGRSRELIGCSEDEVERFETAHRLRLPRAYRQFLLGIGKSPGNFLDGTDFHFGHLPGLRRQAEQLLKSCDSGFSLSERNFVFLSHQGYQFMYFDVQTSDDPPVYHYMDGDRKARKIFDRFSDWLASAVEEEIADYDAR